MEASARKMSVLDVTGVQITRAGAAENFVTSIRTRHGVAAECSVRDGVVRLE
jgi:hypothetical protein